MLFLSHAWGSDALGRDNHARVRRLARALRRHGVPTWLDEDDLGGGHLDSRIARGIEASSAVLVCVSASYCAKIERACLPAARPDYCASEWHYARLLRKPLIPVLMEPLHTWPRGVVAMHLWSLRYADYSESPTLAHVAEPSDDAATRAAREVIQIRSPRRIVWV